jgi:hypothetical protein
MPRGWPRGWPAAIVLLLALASRAQADPILSVLPPQIALDPAETILVFQVDPADTPLSGFLLNFSAATAGIELVSIDTSFNPTFDPQNGLAGFAGTFGTDQTELFTVGSLTVRGLTPGAELILTENSNYTDAQLMPVTAGGPRPVAMVVPEPTTLALMTLGSLGLAFAGRRRR